MFIDEEHEKHPLRDASVRTDVHYFTLVAAVIGHRAKSISQTIFCISMYFIDKSNLTHLQCTKENKLRIKIGDSDEIW